MIYSTENVLVSLTNDLAAFLRDRGYDVLWRETGDVSAQNAGLLQAKATVTFVAEVPANEASIVRLKGDTSGPDEVAVPVLALEVEDEPERLQILGLGDTRYEWERKVVVDAFAADPFQHRALADALHDWLARNGGATIPVSDYDTDAANPPALDPVKVTTHRVRRTTRHGAPEATRYYLRATAFVQYVE